jgi:hypothetical protein
MNADREVLNRDQGKKIRAVAGIQGSCRLSVLSKTIQVQRPGCQWENKMNSGEEADRPARVVALGAR